MNSKEKTDRNSGTLFVVSAPSGAGKTSLVKALLETTPQLEVSVSHTTREKRPGEVDGLHYHFVNESEFKNKMAKESFLEYAKVFNNYYGTSKENVTQCLERNSDMILEIDWQGAAQVRRRFPQCISIFILPPSKQVLRERLEKRGQDNGDTINLRMQEAVNEISHHNEFDFIVVNDQFETALGELKSIILSMRLRAPRQQEKLARLIKELVS